jgi:hypothetical protein
MTLWGKHENFGVHYTALADFISSKDNSFALEQGPFTVHPAGFGILRTNRLFMKQTDVEDI